MSAAAEPIVNVTRGTVVCERGVVADNPLTRLRGLLGRRSLPAGEGLLLRPAPSIHTAFMRFPIDVIFLDRDLQVVKVVEKLGPWRMASARRAHAALELTAGEAAARGVEVGDTLAQGTDAVGSDADARDTGRDGAERQLLKPIGGAADTIHMSRCDQTRASRPTQEGLE